MLIQYYVLKALAREFDATLRGSVITEIYSQQKNELVIVTTNQLSRKETGENGALCISVSPGFNYILMRRAVTRARKNSASLFETLYNTQIEGVTIHPCDRTLTMSVSGGMRIIIRLYNTVESNILLVDHNDRIIESFKRSRDLKGTQLVVSERRFDEKIFEDDSAFNDALRQHAGKNFSKALKEILPQWGQVYIRELLSRASIQEDLIVEEKKAKSIEQEVLSGEFRAMSVEFREPAPIVYIGENGAAQLSVIRLKNMEHCEGKQFKTINEAAEEILAGRFRSRIGQTEKQTLMKKVGTEIGKIEKALGAIKSQKSPDPIVLEYNGQLILSYLDRVKKGMKTVELPDLHKPTGTITVPLNPALTPTQNAEKYFQKARKTTKEREETEIRFNQLMKKLEILKNLEKSILESELFTGVKDIIEDHKDASRMLNLDQKGKEKSPLPFRVFSLEHGYEVWVGKSSASNDLLTMKHAAPHDLWFHVRGASGSHTVLKVKKGENVPREIVHQAAGIAAYYSKMRNASSVPVAYCERKYVRKPKGVASGSVTLEREKVIFVKPNLPERENG
jgi:predicted ribosome quality control (RQC) complex YloA/Tae2 family protein